MRDPPAGAFFFNSLVGTRGFFKFVEIESERKEDKIDDLTQRDGVRVEDGGRLTLDSVAARPRACGGAARWASRGWDRFATKYYHMLTAGDDESDGDVEIDEDEDEDAENENDIELE